MHKNGGPVSGTFLESDGVWAKGESRMEKNLHNIF